MGDRECATQTPIRLLVSWLLRNGEPQICKQKDLIRYPHIKLCYFPSISCDMDNSDDFHLGTSLRMAGPPMPVALEMGKTAIQEVLPLERVREHSYLLNC